MRAQLGGVDLVRVGLGTNRLTHTPHHVDFIRQAVEAGVNFIDTAYLYTGGESEPTIGEALSPVPEGVVVATKGGYRPGEGRPDVLRAQLEESLRRLRTDSIQLYYLHRVDPQTPLEESLGVLAEAREHGEIQHVGISEVGVDEIEQARKVVPIAAVQNHFNLEERKHEEVIDHCEAEGLLFVPYFPLRPEPSRTVLEIAQRHGTTPHQVVLAWMLKRSPAMVPIPGTLSLAHLKENLAARELELSDDEFAAVG
jgi:aryl-alcohol dehydrogenase-like predicted oxidoreductase